VILCYSPFARQADLERWTDRVDAALPEATAREMVARRVAAALGVSAAPARGHPPRKKPEVVVVSTNPSLRQVLAEAAQAAGFPATQATDWFDAPASGAAIWDVPLLEPDWPHELEHRTRHGPVVVLLGFADRALVTEARARGASSCLELPVDLADLADALNRLPSFRAEPAHDLPPPPAGRKRTTPPRVVSEARHDS
jgi:CheY-like chemotaxis protein